ncbi:MAG TPA: alpha-amylase/4-alpha-glucanotransferase domain-containing protein, partial [Longimicrobiales bacterium]|nr:alpha-amylase/4-alpha-glucanotransferase domain-containing protein [Longimicrobiales bacterium]
HLRDAIWRNLAEAEGYLRSEESLQAEWLGVDGDRELWVHSSRFSAVVSAGHGGRIVELTHFRAGVNLANTLTRRRESYHRTVASDPMVEPAHADDAMPSIHELEGALRLEALPPVDLDVRALLVDRVLGSSLDEASYAAADYAPVHSWAGEIFLGDVARGSDFVVIELECRGVHRLGKRIELSDSGSLSVTYRWDPAAFPERAFFAPELSLALDPGLEFDPEPTDVWRHPIVTVSKRESGLEESEQGESVTPRWPAALGRAGLVVPPPGPDGG